MIRVLYQKFGQITFASPSKTAPVRLCVGTSIENAVSYIYCGNDLKSDRLSQFEVTYTNFVYITSQGDIAKVGESCFD